MNTDPITTRLGKWHVERTRRPDELGVRAALGDRAVEATWDEDGEGVVLSFQESGFSELRAETSLWRDMLYVAEVLIARIEDALRK